MTKKRFLSIILTVLMVLSIVPVTTAHAKIGQDKICAGVANEDIIVYSSSKKDSEVGRIRKGQSFTILDSEKYDGIIYYYINYNSSEDPNGYDSYGYVNFMKVTTLKGSVGTVKYNVSVYYGPGSEYQRCGTLYAGETIAVLERDKNHCYVEYNDNVHGRRKRAYVSSSAIELNNREMSTYTELPIKSTDPQVNVLCYVGLKYTVYSGPSTEYEPVGSVSDMHIYWVKRYILPSTDTPFHDMLYIRYQVTGTNTWKSGYIVFNYKEAVGCPNPCTLHPGK